MSALIPLPAGIWLPGRNHLVWLRHLETTCFSLSPWLPSNPGQPLLLPVQFSRPVMSDSLWPHGLQHARLPCPTPIPIAYSISCPWHCDAIQPSRPLSSPAPPAFNLSQHQGLFKWVSSLHQVAKYWSFSFSISPSNEYSGLISFRMDWLDLLAVQGTLENLFQHHSSEASVFSTQSSL